jgi:predicted dehydrogenase/threonine dehydrogenase-like Zn-dependent dehydrogenase
MLTRALVEPGITWGDSVKSVIQPVGGGPVEVLNVPRPAPEATEVLVRTMASVITPSAEHAVTTLARSSPVSVQARPDLVRHMLRKARANRIVGSSMPGDGRPIRDLPLGYSASGEVVEVGPAVSGIRVGQLVATGGAGKASHAEFQAVPGLLCSVIPDGVPVKDAAFTAVAANALHGLRLAEIGPGAKVAVIGLGLVGQLATRLAMAAGCDVIGIDPAAHARIIAAGSGVMALDEQEDLTNGRVLAWSRGRGADAVLVCPSDPAPGPLTLAAALCRDRATVVIVGDVHLDLDRAPFYERELSLRFARSFGPGRHDMSYETWGVDYPAGQVRWTEGRNFEAVLDLLASGRLKVADLVTHSYDIGDATVAYDLIEEHADSYLAVQLSYPAAPTADDPVVIQPAAPKPSPGIGWIGAGAYANETLLPAFRRGGFSRFVAVSSASGITARRAAERHRFEKAVSGTFPVIDDPGVDVVVIATPHDSHAELTTMALKDGRHVWCEKPLALTMDELGEVEVAWEASGRQLMVGFNRRWSTAVLVAQTALAEVTSPRYLVYRVAAGPVPEGHWYADRRQGGRLLGEVCQFVDTAQALIGAAIDETVAVHGGGQGAAAAGSDAVVSLRFADGSLATICYGSAQPRAGKEWIELTAGAQRLVIDDFRVVKLDGKTRWKGRQDKGHQASVTAFRQAVTGRRQALPTKAMLATMRATIEAAAGPLVDCRPSE